MVTTFHPDEYPLKAYNAYGSMLRNVHPYCQDFLDLCKKTQGTVLDLGTTFGWVTQKALETGACVIANDLEPSHLDTLARLNHPRLHLLPGRIPGLSLPPQSLDVVYAAGVLHYLPPADLTQALSDIYMWLKPRGYLVFVTTTPYLGIYEKFRPIFEERVAQGIPWPGQINDVSQYIPGLDSTYPPVTLFDQEGLISLLSSQGFSVIKSSYFNVGKIMAGRDEEGHGMLGSISQKLP